MFTKLKTKQKNAPEIHISTKVKNKTAKGSKPVIPLSSEIIIFITGIIISGVIGAIIYRPLIFVLPLIFIFIEYLIVSSKRSKQLNNMYTQLNKFIKFCSDGVYSDLALYFGTIYTNFDGYFSKTLEECFIEATYTGDSKKALENFKDKYDSSYLNFCIDTLTVIKQQKIKVPSDYLCKQTKSKTDIIKEVHNEQINCKTDLIIASVFGIIIVCLLNGLLGMKISIFFTPIGIILSIVLVVLFIVGILNKE